MYIRLYVRMYLYIGGTVCEKISIHIYFAQMVTMLYCQCSVCKDCFCEHYTMKVKEFNIAQFNCLVCSQPDLAATDIDKEDYLRHFAVLMKEHVPCEVYQLFQKIAVAFSLSKDANFRWCAHVSTHAQQPGAII